MSRIVEAVQRADAPADLPGPSVAQRPAHLSGVASSSGPLSAIAALPALLPPLAIAPALRDPFALEVIKPPPSAAPTAKAIPAVAPQQPVLQPPAVAPTMQQAPTAPPMTMRYLGYLKNPEGRNLVLLADGDDPIPVHAGSRLANGYVVQAIGQNAVRMVYPQTGTSVDVPIPQAPVLAHSANRP